MIDLALEALAWVCCAGALMVLIAILFPSPVSRKDMDGY